MNDTRTGMPILPEMAAIMEGLDNDGVNVLILSLLHWWNTGDSYAQSIILPPYMYKKYEDCIGELTKRGLAV